MYHQDDKAGGGKIAFRQSPKLFIDVLFKKMWEEAFHGQLSKQISTSVSLVQKQKQDHHHHLENSPITHVCANQLLFSLQMPATCGKCDCPAKPTEKYNFAPRLKGQTLPGLGH